MCFIVHLHKIFQIMFPLYKFMDTFGKTKRGQRMFCWAVSAWIVFYFLLDQNVTTTTSLLTRNTFCFTCHTIINTEVKLLMQARIKKYQCDCLQFWKCSSIRCRRSRIRHIINFRTTLNRGCIMLELDLLSLSPTSLPAQLQQLLNVPLALVQHRKQWSLLFRLTCEPFLTFRREHSNTCST